MKKSDACQIVRKCPSPVIPTSINLADKICQRGFFVDDQDVDADLTPRESISVAGTFEYIEAKIRRDAEGTTFGGDFEWL